MMLSSVVFSFCFIPILGNLCQENSATYHFRLGDIRGTVLYDGPLTFSTNPFFVPFEALRSTYKACFRPIEPLTLSQNVLLLESKVGRVLVDPGSRGGQANPLLASGGLLFRNMRAAGILPESIDHIFLTHAHADHVSGLLGLDGGRAFRNAKVYIGIKEHRFWITEPLPISEDHPLRDTLLGFARTYRQSIAPYASRLVLVRDGGAPLPGFRFLPSPGHSPGHNHIQIASKGESLIVSGDAWMSKPDQLQNPSWQVGTESDPLNARRSRMKLIRQAAKNRSLVFAYHEAFPGLGYVVKSREGSFDWVVAPPILIGTGVVQKCTS
ncbi:unnamed protein product [Chondrus crispus]|uniref:Metallo-beta-lactamase domain-containing protein n=1 Tax=Chondrus crispus TaxID=2769 RepID=R7Q4J2_CHOCR|nr:unnamed protein product [Chondrus crispus]CDF32788.1 unnamed protein product [Chondrus crispus]|eukprot:XP_005712589.1 unnamed protein product [Chondrus crispus]